MNPLRRILSVILSALILVTGGQAHAASPYDDYYETYEQPDAQPAPVDNDAYYSAPSAQYPVDNDAYYSAPGSYTGNYATQGRATNCNTIGDMPSCGSD